MSDPGSPSAENALRRARRETEMWVIFAVTSFAALVLTLPRGVVRTMSDGLITPSIVFLAIGAVALAALIFCAVKAVRCVGIKKNAQRALDIEIAEQNGMSGV